jgi:hypothetical protein
MAVTDGEIMIEAALHHQCASAHPVASDLRH